MTQRLPTPGQDDGTWGNVLNGFLEVAHNPDGTLIPSAVTTAGAETTSNKGVAGGYAPLNSSSVVPTTNLGTGTSSSSNFLRGDGTWAVPSGSSSSNASNATTSTAGLVQLAGDLGGSGTTATAPIISDGAITNSKLANGSISTNKLGSSVVTTNEIADGTITNTDISTSAAISSTKLDATVQTNLTKAAGSLQTANNLSDLASVTTAKTNLGLSPVATSGSYTDLTSKPTIPAAQVNSDWSASTGVSQILNKPTIPTSGTTSSTYAVGNDSRITGALQSTNNLSDLVSPSTARTNLGLGTAATISATAGGDLTGTLPAPTVSKINGVTLPSTAPSAGNVLTAASPTTTSWTTPAAGVTLDATSADIQPLGTQTAGSVGKAADAGHVHAMPTLNQVSAPTTALALNSQKITGLANGTASTDAAAFGQIPSVGTTAVGGDLSGTVSAATVAKLNGISVTGTPSANQVLTASSSSAATWSAAASASVANATTSTPGIVQLAGDLAGTATAPTVPALGNKANTTAVLSNLLRPLGGTTNDAATINTLLSSLDSTGGGTVILHSPGSYFRIETALTVGSNTSLVLWDCELRRIPDGASASTTNSNVITNLHMNSTGDSKIRVRGIGRALVNGQASLQTRNTTSINNNFGLFWVNVTDLSVQDVTIGPTQAFASNIQVCTKVRYRNIQLEQDRTTVNQDGLDIGPGCSDVVFDGVTGTTGDDAFSLYAQDTSGSLHTYTKSLTASQRNCSDVTIRNIKIDVGINPVRIQAGDSSTFTNVTVENFVNLRRSYVSVTGALYTMLCFGPTTYVTTPPAIGDIAGITFRGYKGCASYIITNDDAFSDVTIDGVDLQASTDSTTWTSLVSYGGFSSYGGTVSNVAIRNVRSHVPASLMVSGVGYVCAISAGNVSNLSFDNLHLLSARCLTKNGVAINNIHFGHISIATLTSSLYASTVAETGRAASPQIASYTGTTKYTGVATALRLEQGHPMATTADTYLPAPTASSYLVASGVDPTGGSNTAAAVYIGDGVGWNRFVTLANAAGALPSAPTNLTATGGTGTINLSWTASATGSPTSYVIYRGTSTGNETILSTGTITTTSYSDSTVTAGTTYYYKVAGANSVGNGPQSNESSASATSGGTVGFTDTFNRTGSTSGSNWATLGSATFPTNGTQMGIASTSTTSTTTYLNVVSGAAYTATATNVYAQVIAAVSGTSTTGAIPAPVINYTDDSNYYFANFSYTSGSITTGIYTLYKYVAATLTTLATSSTVTAPNLPVALRLQNSANTLTLLVNGAVTLTATDSSLSGVRVGTRWRGGGASGANTTSEAQKIGTFTAGTVS